MPCSRGCTTGSRPTESWHGHRVVIGAKRVDVEHVAAQACGMQQDVSQHGSREQGGRYTSCTAPRQDALAPIAYDACTRERRTCTRTTQAQGSPPFPTGLVRALCRLSPAGITWTKSGSSTSAGVRAECRTVRGGAGHVCRPWMVTSFVISPIGVRYELPCVRPPSLRRGQA